MLNDSQTSTIWTKYYHLDNPKSCKWSSLVPVVQEHFSTSGNTKTQTNGEMKKRALKAVSFDEWVELLEESGRDFNVDVTKNPGLKLLEFYQGMCKAGAGARLDTKETMKGSESMKNLKAVDGEWMRLWLKQWAF
jgi:hypothetical protein